MGRLPAGKIVQGVFVAIFILAMVFLVRFFLEYRLVAYDLAIVNAVIHDGSEGGKGFVGGVGVRGDRIMRIWKGRTWIRPKAKRLIDALGEDLSPGFIDVHSHADLSILASSGRIKADNFIGQGITTVITGNCGKSPTDIPAFEKSIVRRKSNVNIATLIGLNSVRKKVMRESSAPAGPAEISRMCEIVRSGLDYGALGVSTGNAYPPGIFASREETLSQLRVAREFHGIHATHMRSEGTDIEKAVSEAVDISRQADIPLVISHFKITGGKNCGKFDSVLRTISEARAGGLSIYVDFFSYVL